MALDPQPGMTVRVPCRGCGAFVTVHLVQGKTSVSCGKCGLKTEVELASRGDGWLVRTRRH